MLMVLEMEFEETAAGAGETVDEVAYEVATTMLVGTLVNVLSISELCPIITVDCTLDATSESPAAFGHSVATPLPSKKSPIRVWGSALEPVQAVLSSCEIVVRALMQAWEQACPFVKSFVVQEGICRL